MYVGEDSGGVNEKERYRIRVEVKNGSKKGITAERVATKRGGKLRVGGSSSSMRVEHSR
jgi:hypothetical protein